MSKTSSVIQVNGNSYDALTGQLLNTPKAIKSAVSSSKKMVDGFVVGPHQRARAKVQARKQSVRATSLHQKQQHTKTLMRKAVKRPVSAVVEPTRAAFSRPKAADPARESRAKTITMHAKVSRYGFMPQKKAAAAPVSTKVVAASTASAEVVSPRVPSMVTSVSHRKIERMLDEALVRADAHKQMLNANRRTYKRIPRWVLITVISLAVVTAAIILIWQNLPSVAVRVAASRAHVSAAMPGYTPLGYDFAKPLQYKPGAVTISFVNKTDQAQTFSLTQKNSDWDNSSLKSNYLPANAPVQTSQVDGTMVYIYGTEGDAAWVNHGVLYSLKNNAKLSSDQVFKIVQSL